MQATACLSGSHSVGRSAARARSRFHGSSSPTVNNATGCVMPRRNYAKSSRPHFIFETKGKKNSPFKKISRRIKEGGDEMGDRPYFAPCHSGVITSIEQQNEISASSTFVSVSSEGRPPLSFVLFLVPRQIGLHNIGYILGCEHQARRTLARSVSSSARPSAASPPPLHLPF